MHILRSRETHEIMSSSTVPIEIAHTFRKLIRHSLLKPAETCRNPKIILHSKLSIAVMNNLGYTDTKSRSVPSSRKRRIIELDLRFAASLNNTRNTSTFIYIKCGAGRGGAGSTFIDSAFVSMLVRKSTCGFAFVLTITWERVLSIRLWRLEVVGKSASLLSFRRLNCLGEVDLDMGSKGP
jgi:hypothetical protein